MIKGVKRSLCLNTDPILEETKDTGTIKTARKLITKNDGKFRSRIVRQSPTMEKARIKYHITYCGKNTACLKETIIHGKGTVKKRNTAFTVKYAIFAKGNANTATCALISPYA